MLKQNIVKKTKQLIWGVYLFVAKIKIPYNSRSILIIRLDALGDYVLFRNSIQYIKNAKEYQHYNFYLLGNKTFEGLASCFDGKEFKKCVWIDPEILRDSNNPNNLGNANTLKRFLLLIKLKLRAFDIIINPIHSRMPFIDEFINEIGGKRKIASKGDSTNWPSPDFEELSNKYYDRLIEVPGRNHFEFYRNKEFVENLLKEKFPSFDLQIPIATSLPKTNTPKTQIVIVPGASTALRCWNISNFVEVIEVIAEFLDYNVQFIITGSGSERQLGVLIKNDVSPDIEIENRAGSTRLADLVKLINHADLVISNETGTIHIAAAVNTPVICISGPKLYGRFHPYPKKMGKMVETIYPEGFQPNENDTILLNAQSELDVNDITVERVALTAKLLLSNPEKVDKSKIGQA